MFFYNEMEPEGKITRQEWIRVGKRARRAYFQ